MALNGFSRRTAESVVFGAGVLVKSLKNIQNFNGEVPEELKLGATSGGSSFKEELEMYDAYEGIDGYIRPAKQGQHIAQRIPKLTVTLKEATAENLKLALTAATITRATEGQTMDKITPSADIKDSDFVDNICVVAENTRGGLVIIEIKNVLNTGGAGLTFTDKESGSIEMELQGFADMENYDEMPYNVYISKEGQAGFTLKK